MAAANELTEQGTPCFANKADTPVLTIEKVEAFLAARRQEQVHERTFREDRMVSREFYAFLPEDKTLTRESVEAYRDSLRERGLSASTVTLHSKSVNHLLRYLGCTDCLLKSGKPVLLAGRRFGALVALRPTENRIRRNILWLCRCDCGCELEVAAANLTTGRTTSCGCLKLQVLQEANRYIGNTSLRQALKEEPVRSDRAASGYTGVVERNGRFRAGIVYRGRYHFLGSYGTLEDAVRARARAREQVQEDARYLESIYERTRHTERERRRPPHLVS